MHVGVEAVGSRSGGGWSVLKRTLAALADDDAIDRVTVYCSPPETWAGELPRVPHVEFRSRAAEHDSLPRRVAWYALEFGRTVARDGVDAVLCLNGMGQPGVPHVNLVQQAMVLADRSLRRPPSFALRLAAIRQATRRSCREASAVVVQTPWMRVALAEQFHLTDVKVLALGLPDVDPEGPPLQHRTRRLLLVTSDLPYKNSERVRDAFATLRREFPGLHLDVVGARWKGPGITARERVPHERLRAMYRDAVLVIVPSLVESMALPLVEAMSARCPVVAADRPYARDVCDNAALYFAAESTADLVRVAGEVLRDDDLAVDLVARGERRFTELRADRPARRTAELLREVV